MFDFLLRRFVYIQNGANGFLRNVVTQQKSKLIAVTPGQEYSEKAMNGKELIFQFMGVQTRALSMGIKT